MTKRRSLLGGWALVAAGWTAMLTSPAAAGSGPDEGACCFENGHCLVLSEKACAREGGHFQGDGTTCDTVDCPGRAEGACCFVSTCLDLTEHACRQQQGTYQGDGSCCQFFGACPQNGPQQP